MEAICKFKNLKTQVMSYIYEMLDVESIINLAITNTFFRKPNGLNQFSIITYLYINRLMRLYTRECYCYLLSNKVFHKKISKKFSSYKNEDILKGKMMAFIHIMETRNYDIDYYCVSNSQNSDIAIFYQLFKHMPTKYKEMVCLKITKSPFFPLYILEHICRIRRLEILLDSEEAKQNVIQKLFDPVENYFHLGELELKVLDSMISQFSPNICKYFQVHTNCLTKFFIETRNSPHELDVFADILFFNSRSLTEVKVKGGEINPNKSELFFKYLGLLTNLTSLVIQFPNSDEFLEKCIIEGITKLPNLTNCVCSIKFQSSKNMLYKKELPAVNLGEYYDTSNGYYNEEYFTYFINNNSLIKFDFNFDHFDLFRTNSQTLLEKLAESFVYKDKMQVIRLRSARSDEEHFLNFIKSLVKLPNLKEIVLDIMSVSVEFLETLWYVVSDCPSVIKVTNETWAAMSILIDEYFVFYYDIFDESLLNIAQTLCERNDALTANPNEVKLIIKDIDLDIEDKIFNEEIWEKYSYLTQNIHYISFDFTSIPDEVCLKIKYLLNLMPNLKILALEKCIISNYGWEFISQGLAKLNNINELKLICTNISDENCKLLLSRINSDHFINIDFKGNDIGQSPLSFIFQNSQKFSKIIRLKYYNYGVIASHEIFELMEKFLLTNKFIFTLELNHQYIHKDVKPIFTNLKEKFLNIFLQC